VCALKQYGSTKVVRPYALGATSELAETDAPRDRALDGVTRATETENVSKTIEAQCPSSELTDETSAALRNVSGTAATTTQTVRGCGGGGAPAELTADSRDGPP
jgi:hypothetical protein